MHFRSLWLGIACFRTLACDVELGACDEPEALKLLQRSAVKRVSAVRSPVAQCNGSLPTQVFTDVDDTFKSSGGQWPAGCEGLFGKGVVFPGMAQFVLELSRGPNETSKVLQPAVMSARPDGIDFLRIKEDSYEDGAMSGRPSSSDPANWDKLNADMKLLNLSGLRSYHYEDGGISEILNGSANGVPFSLDTDGSKYGAISDFVDVAKMGATKYHGFKDFFEGKVKDADEACVVFIGDDGQGDCHPAAEKMRKYVKKSRNELGLKVAFIHNLTCSKKPACDHTDQDEKAPVFLFRTYLDAARTASQHGYISAAGAERVKKEVQSFYAVYCSQDGHTKAPETLSSEACLELKASLSEDGDEIPREPSLELRAADRFKAFCSHCCKGTFSSGSSTFKFGNDRFRCHNMYHTTSWWRRLLHSEASTEACTAHCAESAN